MLFESWNEMLRVFITTVMVYVVVVSMVRVLGKRTTAKMNNFDWIVTVAMGSMLGSTILLKDVVLLEGLLALTTLVLLQYLLTRLSVHSNWVARTVHAAPSLLLYDGEPLRDALRRERVTEGELISAVRSHGFLQLNEVKAVILESNAEFSVIEHNPDKNLDTLASIEGVPEDSRSAP